MQLGAILSEHGTMFRLWSTAHDRCEVRVDGATHAMAENCGRVFEAYVPGVGHGARYRFVLDGQEIHDPYARYLPDGITGPAMVWRSKHRWRHEHVVRPLREHALYELHVGTFTREGTYAAAADRLAELVDVGFTAIEVMPLAAFGGKHGWGYDGVAHYAPHAEYGTPDDLRAFIDVAHGCGLSVVLDVVYNHFGPAGNVIGRYSPEYFAAAQNAWGAAPNFRQPWMRRYVLDNVRYWLEEFRCDGLRLDAVHAIADPSERHVLHDLASLAENLVPGALLFAEDDRNAPAIVETAGFDATWADDFHHALRVTLTGDRDGYYACYEPGAKTIAETITHGWLYEGQIYPTTGKPRGKPCTLPAEALVYCVQNHDQIGNRALGDRLPAGDKLAAAATLLYFLPMTPLAFQGQEWGASTPFRYFTDHAPELGALISKGRREEFAAFAAFADRVPDPQDPATFERSKLDWNERSHAEHARMLALHTQLLRLRREDPVLARAGRDSLTAEAQGPLLVVTRWIDATARVLLANFSAEAIPPPMRGPVLLASSPLAADFPALPPWSAVIVATQRQT